jgi:hypothetical protein
MVGRLGVSFARHSLDLETRRCAIEWHEALGRGKSSAVLFYACRLHRIAAASFDASTSSKDSKRVPLSFYEFDRGPLDSSAERLEQLSIFSHQQGSLAGSLPQRRKPMTGSWRCRYQVY